MAGDSKERIVGSRLPEHWSLELFPSDDRQLEEIKFDEKKQGVLSVKMRSISPMLIIGFFTAFTLLVDPVGAQSSNVGVVDIAEVFKAHRSFNADLEAMKQDVEMFKANLQREQARLTQLAEEAQRFDVNSVDFKERESEISSEAARLDLFRNQQNREFLEREARLYFDTYVAVSRELDALSNEMGLTLILRVDNKVADPEDRESVLRVVNRNIVYKRSDRDYTAMLIERVNR